MDMIFNTKKIFFLVGEGKTKVEIKVEVEN